MSDLTLDEQQQKLKTKKIADNAISLANIIELTTSVVISMAGKDIADSMNNQSINREVLSNMVANRIKEKILKKEQ